MAKRGIDISAHQGDIDLSALKSQIDFVIIRVGFGTKGTLDQKFKRNVDLCTSLGIPYGFYWYSYALTVADAGREADYFLKAIAPYHPTFGCWFDMEDADGYKKKNGMPSNQDLKDMCYNFCEKVEKAGYYSGIYASKSWFDNQLSGDKLARFDKWVAQWPTSGGKQKGLAVDPNSRTNYSLWQFTSDGKFSGYKGNLDTNYAYREFTNPGNQPVPAPEPSPEPLMGSVFELALSVLSGEYGDGEQRKKMLGARYEEVQNYINHIANADINTLAQEVVNGEYGVGDQRKLLLGAKYNDVQNKVNELLNGSKQPSKSIKKGSKIRFIGTHSYSGMHLAAWTHNAVFDVIEVSGDRIVIGKGGAVTSAVNAKDCEVM